MKARIKKTKSNFICLVTCGNISEAKIIATTLVNERLAACVNILKGIESVFRWKGKICSEKEILLFIKGSVRKRSKLSERIRSLHSYKVPEIIFLKIDSGLDKYIDWLNKQVLLRS